MGSHHEKKDLLIEALRATLTSTRSELEQARADAERVLAAEEHMRTLRQETRLTVARCEEERRAFAKREEAWSERCAELEARADGWLKAATAERRDAVERQLASAREETQRASDAEARAEEQLRLERTARHEGEARLRADLTEARRRQRAVEGEFKALAALAEKQRALLQTKEAQLEVLRCCDPMEAELARARDQIRELGNGRAARDREVEELRVVSEDLRAQVARLQETSRAHEATRQSAARLENEKTDLERRLAEAETQLSREREERAQWARARIDLLTQHCDPKTYVTPSAYHSTPRKTPTLAAPSPASNATTALQDFLASTSRIEHHYFPKPLHNTPSPNTNNTASYAPFTPPPAAPRSAYASAFP